MKLGWTFKLFKLPRQMNKHKLLKIIPIILFNTIISYVRAYNEKKPGTYYIFLWTNPKHTPFPQLKMGHESFASKNCPHQNCYITANISLLKDVTKFDVILFNAITLKKKPFHRLPKRRAQYQKYVLVSSKSATEYPITSRYNNFFNWTWTYKLDSDLYLGYIAVRDKFENVIGPSPDIDWIDKDDMEKTSKSIIKKLLTKSKAAAWIESTCEVVTKYGSFIKRLKKELKKHNQGIDIYGPCGNKRCPNNNLQECFKLLETKYYFYLAFEDSLAEDYVTSQLLTALYHYAVPIVYGGADYSRFMPDGMYLDALELGPKRLAIEMHKIIMNKRLYYDMFRWHRYYSYHNPLHSVETSGVCQLCALINNKFKREELKVYKNIVKWFNDRKDWDIWNTRRDIASLLVNQKKKHDVNEYYVNSGSESDNNVRDSNLSDKESGVGDNDVVVKIQSDDDDDEADIIAKDERNIQISDIIREVYGDENESTIAYYTEPTQKEMLE